MLHNFAQKIVQSGGRLVPLLVPSENIKNPSLTNPSILNDNNKVIVNLRNVNYCLYHSENNVNEHHWGPLCYLHPENNWILQTFNILCEIDNFKITNYQTIDTSQLDVEPKWEFVGLEDGRLVKWDNILYLSGVRRDTTTHGEGRIELSSIEISPDNKIIETSRNRIPAPPPNNSYCEKNWMPILDMPYHYVKWTNPTETVKYDINNKTCETLNTTDYRDFHTGDLRGGSQVLKIKDYYFAIVHEVDLFNSEAGRKNAVYYHRIVLWNQKFELIKVSDRFNFMGAKIEFCCGMAEYGDYYLITFGFQDNASYLLATPKQFIYGILNI